MSRIQTFVSLAVLGSLASAAPVRRASTIHDVNGILVNPLRTDPSPPILPRKIPDGLVPDGIRPISSDVPLTQSNPGGPILPRVSGPQDDLANFHVPLPNFPSREVEERASTLENPDIFTGPGPQEPSTPPKPSNPNAQFPDNLEKFPTITPDKRQINKPPVIPGQPQFTDLFGSAIAREINKPPVIPGEPQFTDLFGSAIAREINKPPVIPGEPQFTDLFGSAIAREINKPPVIPGQPQFTDLFGTAIAREINKPPVIPGQPQFTDLFGTAIARQINKPPVIPGQPQFTDLFGSAIAREINKPPVIPGQPQFTDLFGTAIARELMELD